MIPSAPTNPEHMKNGIFKDRFLTGLVLAGGARLLAVDATSAADETRRRHGLYPEAARLAAEGIIAGLLMSAYIKGEERITLQVQAEDPPFALIVDVRSDGCLRARFTPPVVPRASSIRGYLLAIKHDVDREIYRGVAAIENTNFQGAFQGYLVKSQQTVGSVRIASRLGMPGVPGFALGFLIERMPGMDESLFHEIFDEIATADPESLRAALSNGNVLGMAIDVLEERSVRFQCTCSVERARRLLAAMGPDEIRSLLEEQGKAEMTCNFCKARYELSAEELRNLIPG